MMQNPAPIRARKPSEDGYMLLVAIFLLAMLVLSLSVAAPRIAKSIQRDREVETMHRGQQYARAIQLYYRRFRSYPPSVDALVNTDNIRFLRKKYTDPMTGKDDWKPIMFGQNKTPLAMGFFGQPLGGVAGQPIAGIGPSGSGGIPGNTSGIGSNTGGSSFGGSSFGGSSFGGSSFGGSSTSSSFGSNTGGSSVFGQSNTGTTGTAGSTDTNGTAGSTGRTDANGNPASGTGSSGSSFMSGQTGQTFGGGAIIGFEPGSPKQSILTLKKKNHYNEWEFTYSPLQEMQQQAGGNPGIGTPASGMNGSGTSNTFGGSNSNTFGGSNNSFGGGSGSTFGGSSNTFGSSPTQPAQPQQSPQQ